MIDISELNSDEVFELADTVEATLGSLLIIAEQKYEFEKFLNAWCNTPCYKFKP